jgi:hypothetical protein
VASVKRNPGDDGVVGALRTRAQRLGEPKRQDGIAATAAHENGKARRHRLQALGPEAMTGVIGYSAATGAALFLELGKGDVAL